MNVLNDLNLVDFKDWKKARRWNLWNDWDSGGHGRLKRSEAVEIQNPLPKRNDQQHEKPA